MKPKNSLKIYVLFLILALFILISLVSGATPFDWAIDPSQIIAKARTFVSRLLCLLSSVTPSIVLAFVVIGGIYYLGSADDPSKRRVAKNIIINGIIGGVCVLILIAVAESVGISMEAGCLSGGNGGGTPSSPYLEWPSDGGTLTQPLLLIVSLS